MMFTTLSNLNPSFIKEIFELRLFSRNLREQQKRNLNIPRKKQEASKSRNLSS